MSCDNQKPQVSEREFRRRCARLKLSKKRIQRLVKHHKDNQLNYLNKLKMKIHAYAICWNEEKFLPYYLKWYTSFCEKVVIYDNHSTDRSHEIIKSFPNTEIRLYGSDNRLNDQRYLDIKNHCWKESKADFVIVGDTDEILYHPTITEYLNANKQYSIIESRAFEMVAKNYPQETDKFIHEIIDIGVPRTLNRVVNKRVIFDPKRVKEINYHLGCHRSDPEGDLNFLQLQDSEIKFLHYKWLSLGHVWGRLQQYKKRNILKDGKINNQTYHTITKKEVDLKFVNLYNRAVKVI